MIECDYFAHLQTRAILSACAYRVRTYGVDSMASQLWPERTMNPGYTKTEYGSVRSTATLAGGKDEKVLQTDR